MKSHTLEHSFMLGGTDYANRIAHAIATHPEITEVLETKVETTGKEGGYAAALRIVYRAQRELGWGDLSTVTRHVPLYTPVSPKDLERLIAWEKEQKGLDHG